MGSGEDLGSNVGFGASLLPGLEFALRSGDGGGSGLGSAVAALLCSLGFSFSSGAALGPGTTVGSGLYLGSGLDSNVVVGNKMVYGIALDPVCSSGTAVGSG